jgi:hypothetical protein
MSLKKHLDARVIDKEVRAKLIKKLHKVSQVIDEMGHTPSRQCLDEMIVLIHIKLKEFDDGE